MSYIYKCTQHESDVHVTHTVTRTQRRRLHEIGTYLFLLHVEVVDDDTDEEVEREERADDDEDDEEDVVGGLRQTLGLLVDVTRVDGVLHQLHPSLERRLQTTKET